MNKWISRRMVIMLIILLVLFGLIFGFKLFKGYRMQKAMMAAQPTSVTVSAIQATEEPWIPQLTSTGSFRSILGIDLTTEIAGLVREVNFNDGDFVQKGALLVKLNIETEVATLNRFQAAADLAKINLDRDTAQFAVHAVSKAQVDTDTANLKSAQAQVAEEQSIIDKKLIRAPFSGRIGISLIKPGDYLTPGAKIASLQTLDPIYVWFSVPQQYLPQIQAGQDISLTTNLFPNRIFHGKINAHDAVVDSTTRNLLVEATLDNPKMELLPGIFAEVVITTGKPMPFLTLPQTAISFNPYGSLVYLIDKTKMAVTQSFVTTGETRGDQIQVLSGVKAGDWVVTSGQLKLRNGSPVAINNKVTPRNNPAPVVTNPN